LYDKHNPICVEYCYEAQLHTNSTTVFFTTNSYRFNFPFWIMISFHGWQFQPYFVYLSNIC